MACAELALRFAGELGLMIEFRVKGLEVQERIRVGDQEARQRRRACQRQARRHARSGLRRVKVFAGRCRQQR